MVNNILCINLSTYRWAAAEVSELTDIGLLEWARSGGPLTP